jgi:uncharacterized phage-like protein YoqJ
MDLAVIIAGTGHRPDKLGGYDIQATMRVIDFATKTMAARLPSRVITGMAIGWDMAWAQAALNLGIPYHAYVPFEGQELKWPMSTRLYYKVLLNKAEHVKICSTGGYSKASMQLRNQFMVDDCTEVAALWNGSAGGTQNCISYAMMVGKPYINYWPQYVMALGEGAPPTSPLNDWLTFL